MALAYAFRPLSRSLATRKELAPIRASFDAHAAFCEKLNRLSGDPLEASGGRIVIFRGNSRARLMVIGEVRRAEEKYNTTYLPHSRLEIAKRLTAWCYVVHMEYGARDLHFFGRPRAKMKTDWVFHMSGKPVNCWTKFCAASISTPNAMFISPMWSNAGHPKIGTHW
mmetsp:Transcript_17050/g.35455  ORF Transcript_17050/g.35455 Transcript_17050/m.35455 type:complete len:167 (+) Transcript_17050:2532-3032(+)